MSVFIYACNNLKPNHIIRALGAVLITSTTIDILKKTEIKI